jgi:hypothetical protein
MRVAKALLRYGGVICAVMLSCRAVQAGPPAQALGERQKIGFISQLQGSWVDQQSGLRL